MFASYDVVILFERSEKILSRISSVMILFELIISCISGAAASRRLGSSSIGSLRFLEESSLWPIKVKESILPSALLHSMLFAILSME